MNLNQITLPAVDIEKSKEFYKKLGLKQIVDSSHYARFESPEGDATFSLHQVESFTPSEWSVVYFETERLDELYLELKSKGIVFDSSPTMENWQWKEARLTDPSGNKLCLYYAGENRKNLPWRIEG